MFTTLGLLPYYLANFQIMYKNFKEEQGIEQLLYDGSTVNLKVCFTLFMILYATSVLDHFPIFDDYKYVFVIMANILSPALIAHFISGMLFTWAYVPLRIYNLRKKYMKND